MGCRCGGQSKPHVPGLLDQKALSTMANPDHATTAKGQNFNDEDAEMVVTHAHLVTPTVS